MLYLVVFLALFFSAAAGYLVGMAPFIGRMSIKELRWFMVATMVSPVSACGLLYIAAFTDWNPMVGFFK